MRLAGLVLLVVVGDDIEFPHGLHEVRVAFLHRIRIEPVEEAVAAAEVDLPFAIHFPRARRGPLAVENVRADLRVVLADECAGLLVEHDEARRLRRGNVHVRIVLAVAGADVDLVLEHERRAVCRVVRIDAKLVHHVVFPEDVRVLRSDFDLRFSGADHVLPLVLESALVAVFLPVGIQRDDLAAARHRVERVAVHERRAEVAEVFPVVHFSAEQLRHGELPDEVSHLSSRQSSTDLSSLKRGSRIPALFVPM